MARHLIIGNDVAVATTNGLVADGAVSIQKMSANGPTELVLGDTVANAPQIRILAGGTDGKNIASPWFYGRDVVDYSGKANVAAASHKQTMTFAGTSTEAADVVIKVVRIGAGTPEFFSFATAITSGLAATGVDALVTTAYAALTNLPDWLETACANTGTANVVEGSIRGQVSQSGNVWEENPALFEIIAESLPAGITATVSSGSGATQLGIPGIGGGFAVKAFEESLMGAQYGYYNRIAQPITPASQAVTGNAYDMYVIAATKDGSSASQINGVDNLIEINVALEAASTESLVVENKLNAYFASNFANVIL